MRAWLLSPVLCRAAIREPGLYSAMNPDVSCQVALLCAGVFAAFMGAGKGPVARMKASVFFQG